MGLGAVKGREMWSTFAAVVAHKSLAAFTLSNCFKKTGTAISLYAVFMLLFSCMTPVGVAVGYALSPDPNSPITGILIAIAAGSFLYVGIVEIITKEFHEAGDTICKIIVLVLGWSLMSSLAIWT